jgi:dipeptidyl aminopeptidase/acylaminoacyl peptidase
MMKLETLELLLDRLFNVSETYGARVSPDGRHVCWIAVNVGPTAQLWWAPTDGRTKPRGLVANERDCDYFFWAPDSQSVILGQSRDGDERIGLSQIGLDGSRRDLTDQHPDYYIRGGQLAPGGRFLVYAANRDPQTGAEIEQNVIYRHDLEVGDLTPLARLERAAYVTPRLSPNGWHVLYERKDRHPAGEQVWLVNLDGTDDREIVNVGDERKADALWSTDSTRIVITAETETHRRVGVMRVGGNDIRWLIDDPERDISGAYWPRGSDHIVVTETQAARDVSWLLDPETGAQQPFARTEGTLLPIAPTADGGWVSYHYAARHPMRLVRVNKSGQLQPLSDMGTGTIPARELAAAEDFLWRSTDGLEIHGWLYRPSGASKGAIILVHGGPTAHDEDAFDPEVQYFVAAGFTVLTPNYRGSTGFGLPFQESIKREGWGGIEQDDITTGAVALIQHDLATPGRIGVTGTSYGGYSSWCQITRVSPDVIKAAAPICGMTDLVVDYETTRPDLRPYSEEMMGGSPAQVPERYRERSPIHFVDRIRGKLLIVQGANDPNVTPQNVTDVRARLDAAGVPYEVLVFEDEGHGISKPENRKQLCRRLAAFFTASFEA